MIWTNCDVGLFFPGLKSKSTYFFGMAACLFLPLDKTEIGMIGIIVFDQIFEFWAFGDF